MASFQVQSGGEHAKNLFNVEKITFQCSQIWDARNARFTPCSLPFISAIPAIISILALLTSFLDILRWKLPLPRWLQTFFTEPSIHKTGLAVRHKYYFRRSAYLLLLLSAIGFGAQVVAGVYPVLRREMIFPVVSWAASFTIVAIERPATTAFRVLILQINILASQAIILVDGTPKIGLENLSVIIAILSTLGSIIVIFLMPLRHPMLQHEDISTPFSPPTSELRSPEDNFTLWQWSTVSWAAPLLSLANKKQLNDENVWSLPYEFKHQLLHENFRKLQGSVFRRLMSANGLDIFITSSLGLLKTCCNFAFPVLLQQILRSMGDPEVPRAVTMKYATLTLIVELIANQTDIFALWFQRRSYERSRGEMITMLYEKSLSRKVVSVSSDPKEEPKIANGNSITEPVTEGKMRRFLVYVLSWFRKKPAAPKEDVPVEKSKELATTGKIMNLMRFDAYEVAQMIWDFNYVVRRPFGLVVCVVLIWKLIGWPCLIGIVTVVISQIINVYLSRVSIRWNKARRAATDNKIHKVSQVVESIRHLRWYGWQGVWLDRIMEARAKELHLRVIVYIWYSLINFTNTFASGMFPVVAFYAYTVLAGKPLTVDIAFPALQLFGMLETSLNDIPYFVATMLNAWVAMGRIEEFMKEPDKDEAEMDLISTGEIKMNNASFAWPGATEPILREITLSLSPGFTLICGEVGAGKSALLLAILGELDSTEGEYHRTSEMVGFCGAPWLQSMSIRDNILFSAPYEEARYKQVLEACALLPDMAEFKNGDLSLIGENGVGLSGGQKARVSLARAVYSSANILLLDDPLSALDHQTAELIVRKCLKGPLMKGRTAILVTHRVGLCLGYADQVIEISNGRAKQVDPKNSPFLEAHTTTSSDTAIDEDQENEEEKAATVPEKFMEEERRAHGDVKASVYWEYIKAGNLKWWGALIIVLTLLRTIDVGETWFLKQWGEAYSGRSSKGPFGNLPSPEKNIKPWLIGFFLIAVAHSIAYLVSQTFMLVIVYKSGKVLFERVMKRCTHATFRFYDVTPVGMLMNRLTSDINTVDGNISAIFQNLVTTGIAWSSSIVIIASVTPLFLLFCSILTASYIFIFSHYLPTSQSLRRLEMVSLTPLISNFGEVTAGLTTIRAYGASKRFQSRVVAVTDSFQKMDHFYWSVQCWLMLRFETLSGISAFIITAMAVYMGLSAGLTAFVLTAANKFVSSTRSLCYKYGQLQMDFVSVERIVELLGLEQEPPGDVEPPAWWPSLGGDIIFEDVTIRYAPHLDPALNNINLTIKGGSTTALIGRTGSGKSTLALSLLATTLPNEGRILIDGQDISKVSKQTLRQRITFLAQDPVLFPGTMRQNLDPLTEYSDEECLSVLSKIAGRHQWSLETKIDTGGKNLSQGQRQLVGLARALLRRSAIIIMDEATASIDMETAMQIQEILREEMKGSTVVTIAHRVEAVKDAERCVVLGKGKVIEEGLVGEMRGLME